MPPAPLIAVLTARPGDLTRDLIEVARGPMGGAASEWLSGGEAAEFAVPERPAAWDEIRAGLDAQGVDANLVAAKGRAKRLLIADMDSTMIAQECIDELADAAGVGARVAEITARAMDGALDFEGALRERVALLDGLDESVIAEVLARRITDMPGGAVLVATMKTNGAYAALVSGGFTAFAGPVAARLGFDGHRANVLEIEGGRLTGRVVPPILGREAKVAALREITADLGIGIGDALAVGDGANDLGMLGLAGMGVALHAKPSVQAQCDLRVNHGDLTALLYLQGYRRGAFVAV